MEKVFKVSDLKKLVSESSNEFKAVLGPNVEDDNKKNNGKAYSDAKKRANDYDGGLEHEMLEERPDYVKVDANKTTLDYNPQNATEEMKERWKAQAEGYTSVAEKNNGIAKTGERKGNENAYKGIKDAGKKIHKAEDEYKFTKVQVRDENPKPYSKDEMYESKDGFDMRNMIDRFRSNAQPTVLKEHIKTVYFKKTAFLSEDHMKSRIPDEFKKEGEQFKMKDKTGNVYLMEWKDGNGKILEHTNRNGMAESLNEMKTLYSYTPSASEESHSSRLNENDAAFVDVLNKVRKIK